MDLIRNRHRLRIFVGANLMKSSDITNLENSENKRIKTMLEFLEQNEYIQHLGIEMLEIRKGYGYGKMPYKNDVTNPYGSVHGGVLYSFADIVAGTTAALEGVFATTVNGNMNFLEPGLNTENLYCKATAVRCGRSLSVYKVEISDDDGKLIDDGSFTFYKTNIKVDGE